MKESSKHLGNLLEQKQVSLRSTRAERTADVQLVFLAFVVGSGCLSRDLG